MYDYFYGQQAELFSFYRVPKVLFTDEKFSNISSDAKLLYGIMLDRMNLSAKNGWVDELGRVYIIFTIEEIKGALGCAEKKAVKLLHELENKCGLIERKRIGLGKPNYIYVKNFVDNSVERQFLNCQKDNSGTVDKTLQELSKAQGNNTDIKDTEYSDTDPILSSDFSGRDVEKDEEFQSYYQYFYEELEMDYLSIWRNLKMTEWRLYGSDRKDRFEKELVPDELAYTLMCYQKELGMDFGVPELLELEKIKALAMIAEAINDAPEFLLDNVGCAVKEGIFNSVPEALESIADAILDQNT